MYRSWIAEADPVVWRETSELAAKLETRAPTEHHATRSSVFLFLAVDRPPRRKPLPLRLSHWRRLRRRLHGAGADAPLLLREFYAILHTGPFWNDSDAVGGEITARVRAALPSRRRLKRLRHEAEARGEAARREPVASLAVKPPWGGEPWAVNLRAEDLRPDAQGRTRLSVPPGRPRHVDTASRELMRFLVAAGLSAEAASHLTSDAARWFWGQSLPWRTLRRRWERG